MTVIQVNMKCHMTVIQVNMAVTAIHDAAYDP